MKALMVKILKLPIQLYKFMISPWLGSNCRFYPTCSSYALEALETHGPLYGSWLSIKRILKCNPWVRCDCIDPVPSKESLSQKKTKKPV